MEFSYFIGTLYCTEGCCEYDNAPSGTIKGGEFD